MHRITLGQGCVPTFLCDIIAAMKYSRAHAIAEGKKLVAQDLHRAMGGQAFPGSFRGSHSAPFQAPHQHGFAGPMAHGGEVDGDALARAHAMLYEAKRACGGQVSFKSGGEVTYVSEAKRLLKLWDKIEADNPRIPADRQFSYAVQRAPGLAKFLKLLLQDGYSRSGARATMRGALVRWANEE